MITEDYVSFEVAKLLKEKGFNERSYGAYNLQGEFQEGYGEWNKTVIYYAAPTHQMVSKWIRKTYNIYIDVILLDKEDGDYGYVIQDIITRKYINTSNNNSYKFPEKAFEEALKYLFENVI